MNTSTICATRSIWKFSQNGSSLQESASRKNGSVHYVGLLQLDSCDCHRNISFLCYLVQSLDFIFFSAQNFQSGNSYLDPKRFDECLYYLHKYGSPSSLVAFYVRHGHLKLACRYIIDQVRTCSLFSASTIVIISSNEGCATRGSCIAEYFCPLWCRGSAKAWNIDLTTYLSICLPHWLNQGCH